MNEKFIHAFILKNRPKSAEAEQNDKFRNKIRNYNWGRSNSIPGNGLESNEVDFKMDAGPDREPL